MGDSDGAVVGAAVGPFVEDVGWCVGLLEDRSGTVGSSDAVGDSDGGAGPVARIWTPLSAMRCGLPKDSKSTRRRNGPGGLFVTKCGDVRGSEKGMYLGHAHTRSMMKEKQGEEPSNRNRPCQAGPSSHRKPRDKERRPSF